jgi:hypothetical protein
MHEFASTVGYPQFVVSRDTLESSNLFHDCYYLASCLHHDLRSSPLPILEYWRASMVMPLYSSIVLKRASYAPISWNTPSVPSPIGPPVLTSEPGRDLPRKARCSRCRQSLTLMHSGSEASGSVPHQEPLHQVAGTHSPSSPALSSAGAALVSVFFEALAAGALDLEALALDVDLVPSSSDSGASPP